MGEALAAGGLIAAVLSIYLAHIRKPSIRLLVPKMPHSPMGYLEEIDGKLHRVRVVSQILISNTGSTSGVLLNLEPDPEPQIVGRRAVRYSCAVRDRDDASDFALPAVIAAKDVVLRWLNFEADLGEPIESAAGSVNAGHRDHSTTVRYWYTTTRGSYWIRKKNAEPTTRRRYVDVKVDLLIMRNEQ